ncbi:substance-K receptor-like [Hydractinia symbiolongicarpus]|uniref:substance-K receptor-like n=1 Tax=Hydractinia symbiolongicarpus TaxID=13093 RepID=UPI00254DAC03|nr:substance-K receptor-like [Hydractinia symbiolongicarpus]
MESKTTTNMELWTISLVSYIVPLVLHSIGIVLLLTRSTNVSRSQTIFMINLSLSEICLSATGAAYIVLYTFYGGQNFAYHISMICFLTSCLPYYAVMYILTLDRLAEVYLNIRYPLYWSARKTKYCMITLWLITLCLLFSLFVYIRIEPLHGCAKLVDFSYAYGFPCGDLVFVIIAILTYFYIIKKIRQKRKVTARISIPIETITFHKENISTRKGHRQNKGTSLHLLLPFLLVVSFVLFIEIPDFIFFLAYRNVIGNSFALEIAVNIMYSIGYSTDAFIYVFLSTSLKNLFRRR